MHFISVMIGLKKVYVLIDKFNCKKLTGLPDRPILISDFVQTKSLIMINVFCIKVIASSAVKNYNYTFHCDLLLILL